MAEMRVCWRPLDGDESHAKREYNVDPTSEWLRKVIVTNKAMTIEDRIPQ